MAKITQFDPGELSGEFQAERRLPNLGEGAQAMGSLFNQAASDAGQIAGANYKIAAQQQKQNDDMAIAAKAAAAAKEQVDNENRKIKVGQTVQTADLQLNQLTNDLKAKHQWDTTGMVDDFIKQSDALAKGTLSKTADSAEWGLTETGINAKISEYQKNLQNYEFERGHPIAQMNLEGTAGAFSKTVNDGDMSADTFIAKAKQYQADNLPSYQHLKGGDAQAAMDSDIAKGAKNTLEATALKHPEQLDQKLDALQKYIPAPEVAPFVAQIRANAQQVMKQATIDQGLKQQGVQMSVMQQLQNSPNNKTGRLSDADPTELRAAIATHHEDLGPEMTAQLQGIATVGTKKGFVEADEQALMGHLGELHAKNDALAAKIEYLHANVEKYTADDNSENHQKAHTFLEGMQKLTSQYNDNYTNMNNIAASVTSKSGRQWIQEHQKENANSRFSYISGLLKKDPQAAKARSEHDAIRAALPSPNLYADPKKQAAFKYFWDNAVTKRIMTGNVTTKSNIINKPAYRAALANNVIKHEAIKNTEALGWMK